MVSIKEVARIANVSIATVSRYINTPEQVRGPTQEKVQAAITATGYAPNTLARNFRRGKSGIIFVVMPTVGDPFFDGVMEGIRAVADKLHYTVFIREISLNALTADEYTNMIFSKQADGIILLASPCLFTPSKNKANQPIVVGCESVTSEAAHFPSVRIDNISASSEATHYLISQGHKQIGFIFGSQESMLTKDRELGFRQAMKAAELPVQEALIVEGGLSIEGAREATRQLLNQPVKPTAIFCANDQMAMGCIHEIKAANLSVPDDISVMGFDDIRFAEIADPPLSTVAQPSREIGERTMLRLCNAIEGTDIGTTEEIVKHTLMIRESTGPAPASE